MFDDEQKRYKIKKSQNLTFRQALSSPIKGNIKEHLFTYQGGRVSQI